MILMSVRNRQAEKMDTEEELETVKRKYYPQLSGRDLRASSIGWEIALPIVAGPVIGYFIDKRVGSGVLYTLILLGVGLLIAIWNFLRFINYEFSLIRNQREEEKTNMRLLTLTEVAIGLLWAAQERVFLLDRQGIFPLSISSW